MKKTALLLVLVMLLISLMSCGFLQGSGSTDQGDQSDNSQGKPSDDHNNQEGPDDNQGDGIEGGNNQGGNGDNNNQGGADGSDDENKDNHNSHLISISGVKGLNEQIYVSIEKNPVFTSYRLLYKEQGDSEYITLDENLLVESESKVDCYVLGIKKGNYEIKIEAEGLETTANKIYSDIFVHEQDRSGYAHFGGNEGVGAYNNDGTIKEGTKIVYVTNENKNTVTLEIDGTEYIGLVNILQAQYKSDTPMLIRVVGKITTNQWNYKNVEPRFSDGSNATSDFFVNSFSNEYGENLANLIVKMKGNGGGEYTYNYRTTPEGLSEVRLTNGGTKYTNYKGSDFPSLVGKSVFDDDSYYNMLEVKGSKNITVEGVGPDAEFFQFGISFEECNNIEIKNITFTDYPEDALNFLGGSREDLAKFSRYWVHSCTFNRGYNAWDISGERDKYAGDGSIDFNNVSNLTLAYNFFNNTKKSMLFGSGDSEGCMNFTMHHNNFYMVESRLPLGRNVNIHSYNNYFDQCKNSSDIRKSSFLFSENNYFNSTAKPFINSSSAVKSYGDIFTNSSSNGATIVTDRTESISINCKPDKVTSYSAFDVNSTLFYYNEAEKRTDVSVMHQASEVPDYVYLTAGAGYYGLIDAGGSSNN